MSSFNSIMSNGVSGLVAQSYALGTISGNIANSQTVGYKRVEAQFSDVDVQDRSGRFYTGSGVKASDRQRFETTGATTTDITTNAAINGNGFFMVQDIASQTGWTGTTTSGALTQANNPPVLTRAGDFQPDQYGHLVNSAGNALLGVKLDAGSTTAATSGKPSVQSLQLVTTDGMRDYVEGTSLVKISGNLTTTSSDTQGTPENGIPQTISVVDSSGQRINVNLVYTRTGIADDGTSTWDVSTTGSTYTDGTAVPGSGSATLGTVSFDTFGVMLGGDTNTEKTMTLNAGNGADGITLDFGAYGKYSSLTNVPGVGTNGMGYQQNGIEAGTLKSVDLTDDGYVSGTFGEGQVRYFYRIPNATVINPTDLDAMSGTTYQQTTSSGAINLSYFGGNDADPTTNGTGLNVGAVEQSNTNVETEFTNLIVAQRTYSAASKIITTSDEMTQTTINVKS